jgi:nucleoside 2-deoxyribosyltransferase
VALAAPQAFTDPERALLREVRAMLAPSGFAGAPGSSTATTASIR